MKRLHWGCGPNVIDGWTNVDRQDFGQQVIHDITADGPLPFDDGTFDYAVVNHALQEVGYHQLVPTLTELRRVLVPGGTLRLIEPDLCALTTPGWLDQIIADDVEPTLDGKVCAWLTFYSHRRSMFTGDWLVELCGRAGFTAALLGPGWTGSAHAEITTLDSRALESCTVEATK